MTSDQTTNRILQLHFESLADLIANIGISSEAQRAEAEMDALMIWGSDARDLAIAELSEPEASERLTAATLTALALQAEEAYPAIVQHFCSDNPEFQNAIRLGLRLCNPEGIFRALLEAAADASDMTKIALVDVATFHRRRPLVDLRKLMNVDDPTYRAILLEAMGRLREPALALHFETDTDPIVRRVFWRSLARSGDASITNRCRQRSVQDQPCHDAIRFLGVVGSAQDIPLLMKLAQSENTSQPAIHALGILGSSEVIPELIHLLREPSTAQSAANALERITGRMVPRSDPPPPPEHLTEEELDFWFHPGDPIPDAAEEWWQQNRYYFERGKRYQAGLCLSDDPLGPVFDQLPDDVRRDIYLRQRVLQFELTPDWELETWPRYHRNPAWASGGSSQRREQR
jgi:uncharacterized protein (TIGR02270 family)